MQASLWQELRADPPFANRGRESGFTQKEETVMSDQKMMRIMFAVPRNGEGEKKTWWMKAGAAFQNRDGSWTLRFDAFPARPDITIQLRDWDPKEPKEAAPQTE